MAPRVDAGNSPRILQGTIFCCRIASLKILQRPSLHEAWRAFVWQARRGVPGLVRLAMEARHGLWIADNATRDLHFLDKTPTTLSLDFRQRDAVRVEQGSALCSTMVGGEEDLITLAQLPPRRGDAWSADVALQRGIYSLKIAGWRNPYHGVLDLFLDGKPVTPADGFDWSGPCTAPASHEAEVAIKWTGVHQLLGKTNRSKASRRRHKRFWMCLKSLTITPVRA